MSKAFLFIDRIVTSYPWITVNVHWYFPNSVIDIPNLVAMVTKLPSLCSTLWNVKYTTTDDGSFNKTETMFLFNESRYIALFVVSGSIKLFSFDCFNIYFNQ